MDKPYLSYQEQIEKLQNDYGLIISNLDFALESIRSFSYYDLVNGYQDLYIKNGKYIDGVTFEDLVMTHIFNKHIQGVLIKYSTYVENSFKNILSHVIAANISEDHKVYLDKNYYKKSKNSRQRAKFNKLISKLEDTTINCIDTPTSHYIQTKDHIPPWILFRNISFSNATDFLRFMKPDDKNAFVDNFQIFNGHNLSYEEKYNVLLDAACLVRKFRNRIAHNLNFISYSDSRLDKKANILFKDTLSLSRELSKTRHDVWGMVISIVILLSNNFLAHNFLTEFQSFMNFNNSIIEIYCNTTGIPIDYEQRIENYLKSIGFYNK